MINKLSSPLSFQSTQTIQELLVDEREKEEKKRATPPTQPPFFFCEEKKGWLSCWLAAERGSLGPHSQTQLFFIDWFIPLIPLIPLLNQFKEEIGLFILSLIAFIPLFSSFCFACWDGVPAPITHLFQPAERAGWLGPPNQSKRKKQFHSSQTKRINQMNQLWNSFDLISLCLLSWPIQKLKQFLLFHQPLISLYQFIKLIKESKLSWMAGLSSPGAEKIKEQATRNVNQLLELIEVKLVRGRWASGL